MTRLYGSRSVLALLCLCSSYIAIEASVHEYASERFTSKGNAFVIHAGSEGIYSSVPTTNDSSISANGDSYIR
jgi:hypothetical protein